MHIEHLADCEEYLAMVSGWQHAEFGYLNPAVTMAQRQDRLRQCLQRDRLPLALVALSDEGHPIGAASILPRTITHAHLTPWLSAVVVPAACRGRGVASALSLRAVSEAARLGFETLHLFTPHNESLYQRLGWATFERAHFHGLPIALMSRATRA